MCIKCGMGILPMRPEPDFGYTGRTPVRAGRPCHKDKSPRPNSQAGGIYLFMAPADPEIRRRFHAWVTRS
jgi:hypothetical protein